MLTLFFSRGIPLKFNYIFDQSKNWPEFKSKIDALPNTTEQGDCFELLTKYFLKINPTYGPQIEEVWIVKEGIPQKVLDDLIDKEKEKDLKDRGSDLIAKTIEGKYWAIQSKYRSNEDLSVNYDMVAKCFTDAKGRLKNISHILICSPLMNQTYPAADIGNVGFQYIGGNLDEEFFNKVREFRANKSIKPSLALSVREYQKKAIENASQHFRNKTRGKLIHACGTGKTYTAYWISQKLEAQTILFAAPSINLIKQTLDKWAELFRNDGKKVAFICVCSDKKVEKETNGEFEDDIRVGDLGIEVSTSPKRIKEFLDRNKAEVKVVLSTYQSGKELSKGAKLSSNPFDIAIFDEAHNTVNQKGRRSTHLLFDENIYVHKRIFMTATERMFKGDSDVILSMDQKENYGEMFDSYSFLKAIEDGFLCDYEIATIGVNDSEIKSLIEKIERSERVTITKDDENYETTYRSLAYVIALRKAQEKHGCSHVVSYHNKKESAKSLRDNLRDFGKLEFENDFYVEHINGEMNMGVRQKKIDEFTEARCGFLTNPRCLAEGVDIPKINAIFFADPKKSVTTIVQAIGRGLRLYESKEKSYVIIPIITKQGDGIEDLDKGSFSDALAVVYTLAAFDDRIRDYIECALDPTKKPKYDSYPIDESYKSPLSETLDPEKAKKFSEAVTIKIHKRLSKFRYLPFEEAREFVRGLGLKNQEEWRLYCKEKLEGHQKRPDDIPATPGQVYKLTGWNGMGDWLGTGYIHPRDRQYRSFEEARQFVRSLGLKNQQEWSTYCKEKLEGHQKKPDDIPTNPQRSYKGKGWNGMGDWLGTGYIATRDRQYPPFKEARQFVRSLGLKNQQEWRVYCKEKLEGHQKKPDDIPANPNQVYKKKGWKSWGDWLGTGYIHPRDRQYPPFKEARQFVRSLGLKNQQEWRLYCKGELEGHQKKPDDIPANPNQVYKKRVERYGGLAWYRYTSMGDWLGTGYIPTRDRQYRSFEEARQFVRSLGLKNQQEWSTYCKEKLEGHQKKPDDIPANPNQVYKKKGWNGMGDWLGTGYIPTRDRQYRSFEEARQFVRSLGLKNQQEWSTYCKEKLEGHQKKPDDIPANPNEVYKKKGWKSWGDWLGTGNVACKDRQYRPFEEARKFVRGLNIKNRNHWVSYCKEELEGHQKKPNDIPANPTQVYKKKGWKSWGDWLGTGNVRPQDKDCRSFEEARQFVRSLGLKNQEEWRLYCKGESEGHQKKPDDIPAVPERSYKGKGWNGMGDWLGTGNVSNKDKDCRSFEKAREFVRSLGLKNQQEWRLYCKGGLEGHQKKPDDIPTNPYRSYKGKGWNRMGDWLGTGYVATKKRRYRMFGHARKFVRGLNLKSYPQWKIYCSGKLNGLKKPKDIPSHPEMIYKEKGWKSWANWLGTGNVACKDRQYRPFEEALEFVRGLGLKNHKEWLLYCKGELEGHQKRPDNIPANPARHYKEKGWISWVDWIGKTKK